jgi:hypothetical protein
MSRNSCMFPDGALYKHPSIIFVDFDFIITEHTNNILFLQIWFRPLFCNLYIYIYIYIYIC